MTKPNEIPSKNQSENNKKLEKPSKIKENFEEKLSSPSLQPQKVNHNSHSFNKTLQKEKENRILDFLYYWGRPIKAGEICKRLEFKHSTLNSILKQLVNNAYIEWEKYGVVELTTKGQNYAAHLSNHHFIVEKFLKISLNLEDEFAHQEAIHLAGAVSCELIAKICETLNIPLNEINFDFCENREYHLH